jgi:hypothetical protein
MHPYLQHAYALLLEGPLGIQGLCDLVTDYAKCLIGDARHGSTFLIIGRRQAGKTTLLRDLLHRREYYYKYGEIMTRVDTSDVGTIPMMQDMESVPSYVNLLRRDFFIGHELSAHDLKSHDLGKMVWHARHFKTDVILCTQYALDIPQPFRRDFDIVFVFAEQSQAIRKRLYETFFGCVYKDFSAFESDFKQATRDFGCLCVNRRNYTVLHFRADPNLPPFSM